MKKTVLNILIVFTLSLYAKSSNLDSLRIIVNKAVDMQEEGEYADALIGFEKALRISDSISNTAFKYELNLKIGNLFTKWDDINKAIAYYRNALNIAISINDKNLIAGAYNNIGTAISSEDNVDSSLVYYRKAYVIYKQLKDSISMAGTMNNIGTIYTYKKEFKKSLLYYKNAFRVMNLVNNHYAAATFSLNIASSFMSTSMLDSAIHYIEISDKKTDLLNNIIIDLRVTRTYAQFYKKIKDYKKANYYLEKYISLNDSLFSIEKQRQIVALQEKYEAEKQKNTIELLKKEKEINQIKLRKQNIYIYSIVVGVCLILIVLFLVIRQKTLKTKFLEAEKLQFGAEQKKFKSDQKLQISENELLVSRILYKERELVSATMHVLQKNELIQKLKTKLDTINIGLDNDLLFDFSKEMKSLTSQTGLWQNFSYHFEQVHPGFFIQLKKKYPQLTQYDLKLSAYIKIGLNNKEIASLMQIAPESVKTAKKRFKKKINLSQTEKLYHVLLNMFD